MYRELLRRYKASFAQKDYLFSVLFSVIAFLGSLLINNLAIQFATEHASNPVTDIILSNIPVVNVDDLFVYGTFLVGGVSALIVFTHPKRIPFAGNTLALFFLIRSCFTSLTHTGPFAPHVTDFGQTITSAFFGADFFFSGHTGMPFLAALVFWDEKPLRYFYLLASIAFAAIVLVGHLHYSIDVFSAFFITFSIYKLGLWLFPRDHTLFKSEL